MDVAAHAKCRAAACRLNQALPRHELVVMHSGNGSVLDRASGRVFIKPSGMDYDQIAPADIVEVDLDSGQVVRGQRRPSVDLPHHLYLYRHLPEVNSIIHTHSNHATAFAACLQPIPLCLTAIADEFGAEIPCTPYVDNDGDTIGRTILAHRTQAPAVLLGNHGVFAWGPTAEAALKAAVMVEDTARTVYLAMQIGRPALIPATEAAKWHDRYWNRYGQVNSPDASDVGNVSSRAAA
ncbi:MAG: class II aldolase/adducin family protein [Pirellulales bacterium]